MWVAAVGVLLALAGSASAAPLDELRAAVEATRAVPHTALLSVRQQLSARDTECDAVPFGPSLTSLRILQHVAGPGRWEAVATGDTEEWSGELGSAPLRFTRVDGRTYVVAPDWSRTPLLVSGFELGGFIEVLAPGSPLRFPLVDGVESLAIVGEDQARVRMRGMLSDSAARFVFSRIFRDPSEDAASFLPKITIEDRSFEVLLDRTVGRLVTHGLHLQFAIPFAALEIGEEARGTLVVRYEFEFEAGRARPGREIRPPRVARPLAAVRELRNQEQTARGLLERAAGVLQQAHEAIGTYQVTLRELRLLEETIRFQYAPGALAAKAQVQLVSLGTNTFTIRTSAATGNVFTLTRQGARSTVTCRTSGGGRCTTPSTVQSAGSGASLMRCRQGDGRRPRTVGITPSRPHR